MKKNTAIALIIIILIFIASLSIHHFFLKTGTKESVNTVNKSEKIKDIYAITSNITNDGSEDQKGSLVIIKDDGTETAIPDITIDTDHDSYDVNDGKILLQQIRAALDNKGTTTGTYNATFSIISMKDGAYSTENVYHYESQCGSASDIYLINNKIYYNDCNESIFTVTEYDIATGKKSIIIDNIRSKFVDKKNKQIYYMKQNENKTYIYDLTSKKETTTDDFTVPLMINNDKLILNGVGEEWYNNIYYEYDKQTKNKKELFSVSYGTYSINEHNIVPYDDGYLYIGDKNRSINKISSDGKTEPVYSAETNSTSSFNDLVLLPNDKIRFYETVDNGIVTGKQFMVDLKAKKVSIINNKTSNWKTIYANY